MADHNTSASDNNRTQNNRAGLEDILASLSQDQLPPIERMVNMLSQLQHEVSELRAKIPRLEEANIKQEERINQLNARVDKKDQEIERIRERLIALETDVVDLDTWTKALIAEELEFIKSHPNLAYAFDVSFTYFYTKLTANFMLSSGKVARNKNTLEQTIEVTAGVVGGAIAHFTSLGIASTVGSAVGTGVGAGIETVRKARNQAIAAIRISLSDHELLARLIAILITRRYEEQLFQMPSEDQKKFVELAYSHIKTYILEETQKDAITWHSLSTAEIAQELVYSLVHATSKALWKPKLRVNNTGDACAYIKIFSQPGLKHSSNDILEIAYYNKTLKRGRLNPNKYHYCWADPEEVNLSDATSREGLDDLQAKLNGNNPYLFFEKLRMAQQPKHHVRGKANIERILLDISALIQHERWREAQRLNAELLHFLSALTDSVEVVFSRNSQHLLPAILQNVSFPIGIFAKHFATFLLVLIEADCDAPTLQDNIRVLEQLVAEAELQNVDTPQLSVSKRLLEFVYTIVPRTIIPVFSPQPQPQEPILSPHNGMDKSLN